jgi:predicted transcriptional regulator
VSTDSEPVPERLLGSLGAPIQDVVDWDAQRIMDTFGVGPAVAQLLRDRTEWNKDDAAAALGLSLAALSKWRNHYRALIREADEANAAADELDELLDTVRSALATAKANGDTEGARQAQESVDVVRRQAAEFRAAAADATFKANNDRNSLPAPLPRKGRDPVWRAGTIRLWAMRTARMTIDAKPTHRWQPRRLRPTE